MFCHLLKHFSFALGKETCQTSELYLKPLLNRNHLLLNTECILLLVATSCENFHRVWMSFHLLLQKLFCTPPASPGWKCNTLPKSRLRREEEEEEKTLESARRHGHWTLWRHRNNILQRERRPFVWRFPFFCSELRISSLSATTSASVWVCVSAHRGFRAIFLSCGRAGVTEGGQYGARGSRRVQLALIGTEGAGGQSGTRLREGWWRVSGQDLETRHNILNF